VLEDEIGALVTLTPIPPSLVSQETNIVSRGGIINDPGDYLVLRCGKPVRLPKDR